eukprot:14861024-Alexandrium_andersonii.AAC.1
MKKGVLCRNSNVTKKPLLHSVQRCKCRSCSVCNSRCPVLHVGQEVGLIELNQLGTCVKAARAHQSAHFPAAVSDTGVDCVGS